MLENCILWICIHRHTRAISAITKEVRISVDRVVRIDIPWCIYEHNVAICFCNSFHFFCEIQNALYKWEENLVLDLTHMIPTVIFLFLNM